MEGSGPEKQLLFQYWLVIGEQVENNCLCITCFVYDHSYYFYYYYYSFIILFLPQYFLYQHVGSILLSFFFPPQFSPTSHGKEERRVSK